MTASHDGERIQIVRGDITQERVDAIVNAANPRLLGGGGVDGAIHRAAGPGLLAECRTLNGCPPGQARITSGHQLPAKFVIHAVGPIWSGGKSGEAAVLASCYRASLNLAREHDCETIAFPAISCGAYGYPLDNAARVSIDEVREYVSHYEAPRLIKWVMFDAAAFSAWNRVMEQ